MVTVLDRRPRFVHFAPSCKPWTQAQRFNVHNATASSKTIKAQELQRQAMAKMAVLLKAIHSYSGDYEDGRRSGKGTYKFASGTVYEGDYVNNAKVITAVPHLHPPCKSLPRSQLHIAALLCHTCTVVALSCSVLQLLRTLCYAKQAW